MMSDLTGKVSENVAKEWTGRDLAPALVFWLAAIVLVAPMSPSDWHAYVTNLPATAGLATTIIGIAVLVGTSYAMNELVFPALRLLEGYWPSWSFTRRLRLHLVRRHQFRRTALLRQSDQQAAEAAGQRSDSPHSAAQEDLANTELELLDYPAAEEDLMPTRIGNIIRAGERHSDYRYGLDMHTTWMHLLQLMPARTFDNVVRARIDLNKRIACEMWALLFVSLALVNPWCLVALPVVAFLHLSVIRGARNYAHMIRIGYDLHRGALYAAFGQAVPNAQDERTHGEALTRLIQRGHLG